MNQGAKRNDEIRRSTHSKMTTPAQTPSTKAFEHRGEVPRRGSSQSGAQSIVYELDTLWYKGRRGLEQLSLVILCSCVNKSQTNTTEQCQVAAGSNWDGPCRRTRPLDSRSVKFQTYVLGRSLLNDLKFGRVPGSLKRPQT